jgi:hypothetical protein
VRVGPGKATSGGMFLRPWTTPHGVRVPTERPVVMNRRQVFAVARAGAGSALLAAESRGGETLYNGILPSPWPPRIRAIRRDPVTPPYLKAPPAVIPIDVGRQLLVHDFLVEATTLAAPGAARSVRPAPGGAAWRGRLREARRGLQGTDGRRGPGLVVAGSREIALRAGQSEAGAIPETASACRDAEPGLSGAEPLTQHQPPRSQSPDEAAAQALCKAVRRTPSAGLRRSAEGLLKKWSRCDRWSRLGRRLTVGRGPLASTPGGYGIRLNQPAKPCASPA